MTVGIPRRSSSTMSWAPHDVHDPQSAVVPTTASTSAAMRSASSAVQWRMSQPTEPRSEEHTSELQSLAYLVCRLLLEKKKKQNNTQIVAPPFMLDGTHPESVVVQIEMNQNSII